MLLDRLRAAGLTVSLTERGTVRIAPASTLTDAQRAFLAARRDAVAAELRLEEAANDADLTILSPATRTDAALAPPVADLARGRRLLERLRWTRRTIGLDGDGALVVVPRLGTADVFGQEVAEHPGDIVAALVAEAAGGHA